MRRLAGIVYKLLFLTLGTMFFLGCDEDKVQNGEMPEIRPLTAEEKFLIETSNEFAIDLINDQKTTGNISLSPISAAMALGIIGNAGTEENFESYKYKMGLPQLNSTEINKAFFEVSNMLPHIDKSVKVGFTNSVWTNYNLTAKQDFYNKVMAYYNTDIWEFGKGKTIEKKQVDKWIVDQTGYLISIENYNPSSNFKVINVSTFSGKIFDGLPSQRVKTNFQDGEGVSQKVDMNFYSGVPVNISKLSDAVSLEIPMGNSNYFLNVILPNDPHKKLDDADIMTSINYTTTNLLIPDIVSSYEYTLDSKFEEFGAESYLREALSVTGDGLQTSLSGVNKSLVNIRGTKFNPQIPVSLEELQVEGNVVKVDRPFYYLIKEKNTELIVFVGKFYQIAD